MRFSLFKTGTWGSGSTSYVNSCTAISQSSANSSNSNTYVTCSGVYNDHCPNGNTVMCQKKVTYSRTGCSAYNTTASSMQSGLTSCSESSNKNYKYTCASYYTYSGSVS